ncbi:hypothetical protein GGX14DRAFT_654388 [Mycena pura]|uniref:Uncharacterized protein n=1 Tax=Mycena pura TaxID=153505 RepID=A0AAD6V4R0_9AGAR|nr:hypothetical protein GGX14DRAFT_654388 [Mycena pura]
MVSAVLAFLSVPAFKTFETPFWFDMACLWLGTFFYGIYLVLFCICLHILLHRPRNTANSILLATAIALFTLSTVQAVLNLVLGSWEILNYDDVPFEAVSLADDMIFVANNLIADALVIYRCYVIWNRNIFVIIPGVAGLIITSVFGWDINLPLAPFFALTLATNVVVTCLTAGRIWWICRRARAHGTTDAQKRSMSALSIIIESGMIYSAFVVVLIAVEQYHNFDEIVVEMLRQVMGIVPTLIIVRVGLGLGAAQGAESSASAAAKSGSNLDSEAGFVPVSAERSRHILGPVRPMRDNTTLDSPDIEKGLNSPYPFASAAGTSRAQGF